MMKINNLFNARAHSILFFLLSIFFSALSQQNANTDKVLMGFDISLNEFYKIDTPSNVKPLEWYELINTKDEQHFEWRLDSANKLTVIFESSNYVGYKQTVEMPRISKTVISRDSVRYFKEGNQLNSSMYIDSFQNIAIQEITQSLIQEGVGFKIPPLATYADMLKEGQYNTATTATSVIAVSASDSIYYNEPQGVFRQYFFEENKIKEVLEVYSQRTSSGFDLPITRVEREFFTLPSGACVEKVRHSIFSNFNIYENNERSSNYQEPAGAFIFRLFPNPSEENLTYLTFFNIPTETIQIKVLDLLGRVVKTEQAPSFMNKNNPTMQLNISLLAKGKYFVRAFAGEKNFSQMLIIH